MEIKRVGSQPSSRGSADYFTGAVRLDPLFQAPGHLSPVLAPPGIRIHSNGVVAGAYPKLLPAKAGPVCGAISEGESRSYSKHQL